MVTTTHGPLDELVLARTVGFEDRPNEFVVWVEWKMPAHGECDICRDQMNPQPAADGTVLVRRDAHCILKQPSVVADAIAGGL
jgi:hypothetical protein